MMSSSDQRFLGIEIGGTKLQVSVGTAMGTLIETARANVPKGAGGGEIRAIILDLCRQLIANHAVSGVGAGFGGPVDIRTGTIARSHQVEGWDGFSLRSWLEGTLDLPTAVENDSNTAALAEARLGAGSGHNPVFYTNLGSGVGGGLVHNGRITHGRPPGEAEIGHLRLSPGGPIVESVCSGWALDQRLRALAAEHADSTLARMLCDMTSGESRVLPEALAGGDVHARQALDETVEAFGFALSHVVHLVSPEIIVIGGGLSHLGDVFVAPLKIALASNIMEAMLPAPDIRTATLGEEVVPTGAILLAADAAAQTH
ncbi:MAG: ROK family protein [Opitutaceae bacterium]